MVREWAGMRERKGNLPFPAAYDQEWHNGRFDIGCP